MISIKKFQNSDYSEIKELFRKIYPNNTLLLDEQYFDWQFLKNPFNKDGEYTMWVLKKDNKICGFYGYVPVEISCEGKIVSGCEPTMWWVDSSINFYGLQLLNKIRSEFDMILFHYCSQDSQKIFKQMGFELFNLKRCVITLTDNDDHKIKKLDLGKINQFQNENESFNFNIEEIKRFDDSQEISFQHYESIQNHLIYSGKYLNWRYKDIPFHSYRIFKIDISEYIIFRIESIEDSGHKVLRIIEWNVSREKSSATFSQFIKILGDNKLCFADFYSTNNELLEIFQSMGFTIFNEDTGKTIPQLFNPINVSEDFVSCIDSKTPHKVNPSNWYLTKGNADLDREKHEK